VFDETGNFVFYSSLVGIKMVNIKTNKLVRLLGKVENTERFLSLALFQGMPTDIGENASASLGAGAIMAKDSAVQNKMEDPCLFTCAFKKSRFYWFSQREPEEPDGGGATGVGRDVFNEKPLKEKLAVTAKSSSQKTSVIMHTTMGDMTVSLHSEECPKTVENFVTHCQNGYYNGTIFHRIIPEFMIQGGDPQGDGTGGESIWGGEFEDEFHRDLRHDRAGILSMANAGPGTNGSQFFVTTVPCPWLDNKHTVFGRIEKGMDVVHSIEKVKTRDSRPLVPIKIINMEVKQ
jgi:peptidylprolyl isomerase domain and WD repeat-containing protein 1